MGLLFNPRPEVRYYFYRNPEAYDVVLVVVVAVFLLGFLCNFWLIRRKKKRQDPSDGGVPLGSRRTGLVLGILLLCAVLALAARILL